MDLWTLPVLCRSCGKLLSSEKYPVSQKWKYLIFLKNVFLSGSQNVCLSVAITIGIIRLAVNKPQKVFSGAWCFVQQTTRSTTGASYSLLVELKAMRRTKGEDSVAQPGEYVLILSTHPVSESKQPHQLSCSCT